MSMGAASCGAASTQALVRRRERDSPQSEIHHLFRESIPDRDTKEKLIVFIKIRKKSNGKEGTRDVASGAGRVGRGELQ